jgi:hypothetical protein
MFEGKLRVPLILTSSAALVATGVLIGVLTTASAGTPLPVAGWPCS